MTTPHECVDALYTQFGEHFGRYGQMFFKTDALEIVQQVADEARREAQRHVERLHAENDVLRSQLDEARNSAHIEVERLDAVKQLASDMLAYFSRQYGDGYDCPEVIAAFLQRGDEILPVG